MVEGHPVTCTDSVGNTYVRQASMLVEPDPEPDQVIEGARVESFWCQSSVGAMAEVDPISIVSCPGEPVEDHFRVAWDNPVYNRTVFVLRFRHHSGAPFSVRTYGSHDAAVKASDRVFAPGTLPTWTFATKGTVFSVCWAADDGALVEPEPGGSGYRQQSPLSGVFGTSSQISSPRANHISMSLAWYDQASAGTTPGLQVGFNQDTNANHLPVFGSWKTVVAFGIAAAPAQTLDWKLGTLVGRPCLDDVGWDWVRGFAPSLGVHLDIQTGDGILVFAGAPEVNYYVLHLDTG